MIFCVEDDRAIRELMIYTLNATGFEAAGFSDGAAFFKAMEQGQGASGLPEMPELILLDIMLPLEDGLSILRKLRANPKTADIPVIMATAKGTEFDKVTGLDLGADDYLAKPFGMMEMVSRIKAVLRRVKRGEDARLLQVGDLKLNVEEHTVFVQGERIELTLKEYELLYLFLNHLGRVFTRDQLLEQIWEADYLGETRTVDVHIGTLRTKLLACGAYIETVRGVGYRMKGA